AAARRAAVDRALAPARAGARRQARRGGVAAAGPVHVRPGSAARVLAGARTLAGGAPRDRDAPPVLVRAGGGRAPVARARRGLHRERAGLPDVAAGDDRPGVRAAARAHPEVRL